MGATPTGVVRPRLGGPQYAGDAAPRRWIEAVSLPVRATHVGADPEDRRCGLTAAVPLEATDRRQSVRAKSVTRASAPYCISMASAIHRRASGDGAFVVDDASTSRMANVFISVLFYRNPSVVPSAPVHESINVP